MTEYTNLSKRELQIVRSLVFDRIVLERGVEAASLVWIMGRRLLEQYPEATILVAVRRYAASQPGCLTEDSTARVSSDSLDRTMRRDSSELREYVDTCVIAEDGVGAVPTDRIEAALAAAMDYYRDQGAPGHPRG